VRHCWAILFAPIPLNEPGTDIRFAIPIGETNNPSFKHCADVGNET